MDVSGAWLLSLPHVDIHTIQTGPGTSSVIHLYFETLIPKMMVFHRGVLGSD